MVTFKVLAFLLNMYSNGSAMPGNTAGNNLLRVHSVLSSYCSEYLYVIQNETITIIILVLGTPRSHQDMSHEYDGCPSNGTHFGAKLQH
jgi:hypothetical protein